ncbi:unnamed protein product [Peniophora sp. CBMAI 1063]|nr:unnamed protein product [Peniophora sp. CBMAI 1063]
MGDAGDVKLESPKLGSPSQGYTQMGPPAYAASTTSTTSPPRVHLDDLLVESPHQTTSSLFGNLFACFARSGPSAIEMRSTIHGLLRDVVQRGPGIETMSVAEAARIIDSCDAACAGQGMDLPTLLRARMVEGHTLVYWAILAENEPVAKLLLEHTAPWSDKGAFADDVRAACAAASNDTLWRRLRSQFPILETPASPVETVVLAGERDKIAVTTSRAAFKVDMHLPYFQRRMRAMGRVSVDLIAQARIFRISFIANTTPDGAIVDRSFSASAWLVSFGLQGNSTPTPLYARVTIQHRDATSTADNGADSTRALIVDVEKKALSGPSFWGSGEKRVPLLDNVLQDDDSPYIDGKGMLIANVEVHLEPPLN